LKSGKHKAFDNPIKASEIIRLLSEENEGLRRENKKLKRLLREGFVLINRIEKEK
jgi:hypothetical protein